MCCREDAVSGQTGFWKEWWGGEETVWQDSERLEASEWGREGRVQSCLKKEEGEARAGSPGGGHDATLSRYWSLECLRMSLWFKKVMLTVRGWRKILINK